ncbi:hypothetical protein GCM10023228_36790 [Brevibacillus fulvus]
MRSRYFNQITYDAKRQTVTKRSLDEQKLSAEIRWYLELPAELQRYIPQIVDYSLLSQQVFVTMEYIHLPTVGQLYLDNGLTMNEWQSFFGHIFALLRDFSRYTKDHDAISALEDMYIVKTWQRLSRFLEERKWANRIYHKGCFQLNGRQLVCPVRLLEQHEFVIRRCISTIRFQLIHGDLCFSNLFFDPERNQLLVIDPRGNFGNAGAYGDVRYDLAKMRHSLSGYEHIVRDRYEATLSGEALELKLPFTPIQKQLQHMWDDWLGSSLAEVKLIESLLFLSMLPLHRDQPKRQLALYALGAQLLTEAISGEKEDK